MNKKGFLLGEETVKIVLAVIGITFLFVILFKIYYNYQTDQNVEIAKATLERLNTEINAMPNGGTIDFEIYGPKDKLLLKWDSPNMPNTCANVGWQNCLCICKTTSIGRKLPLGSYLTNDQKKQCDEWACIQSPPTTLTPTKIEIQNIPLKIKITKTGNQIEIKK